MPTSPAHRYSRPVFDQTLTVHSDHAQRLLDRGFHLVVRALYGIDVVLRILGEEAEMDEVEGVVSALIQELAQALAEEGARLAKLREDHGVTALPRYTNPEAIQVRISTPQVAQYTALIQELDRLMVTMDALWLTGILTNKQRAQGAYAWRTRLLRTGRQIIDIERRARASALKRGKGEELAGTEAEGAAASEEASESETPVTDVTARAEGPEAAGDGAASDTGPATLGR